MRQLVTTLGLGLALAVPALAQVPPRDPTATLNFPQVPGSFGYSFADAFPGLTFTSPVAIVSPPGETNRLFVIEQAGRIRVIPNLASPTLETFLDLRQNTVAGGEQGLLGLAFHPQYAANGRFFVFRTVTASTVGAANQLHDRLSEFRRSTSNANRASSSERILFQQYDEEGNHNAGALDFGPDGYLYVSLGDEGAANDSQQNSQKPDRDFFSAILRLDVDDRPGSLAANPHPAIQGFSGNYRIPADNPFVGATQFLGRTLDPAKVRTEIYSLGWRNPWRMSFDRATGELWVADVGQDSRESIAITRAGANHGWAYREGDVAGPYGAPVGFTTNPEYKYVPPVYVYRHGSGPTQGNSVTGGFVYRGSRLGQLHGAYVFADYVSGNVWSLRRRPGQTPLVTRLTGQSSLSAFGADPRNGDVLAAHHTGNRLLRLNYNATFVGAPLPRTLADTGAFRDVANLEPHPAFVPYEVNLPFWSDHAAKGRWFLLPGDTQIQFSRDQTWGSPVGTVWMKHFDFDLTPGEPTSRRRLETRFLVRNQAGVYGVTYRWTSGSQAELVPDEGADEALTITAEGATRTQVWRYPSRAECLACHTAAAGGSLSFNTPQLNRLGKDGVHQLAALATAGYLQNPPASPAILASYRPVGTAALPDLPASLESRARAYLAVNCAPCHRPGGTGASPWDARSSTALDATGILNGVLNDSRGDNDNRVVVPGDPAHSVLLQRMQTRGAGQMPPLGSTIPDAAGAALLEAWIRSLSNRVDFPTWASLKLGDTSGNPPRDRDSDLDGAPDYFEFLAGTDPKQSSDTWRPRIEQVGDQVRLRVPQPANVAFQVESAVEWDSRGATAWIPLEVPENTPFYPAEAREAEVWLSPTEDARYYRVRLLEP